MWGTEEALEEAIEKKGEDRKVAQHKKFKKKMQGGWCLIIIKFIEMKA